MKSGRSKKTLIDRKRKKICKLKIQLMKYWYLQILFLIAFQNAGGSYTDSLKHNYIGIQAHYGFIIPHSASIREISHTRPFGFEISWNRLHTSPEKYRVFNAYWVSGIELRYFNFQNPEILGSVYDLTLFAEPVVVNGKNYLFTVRGGAGLSYHTKVYDAVENPLNMFFSSHISFPLYVDARFKYRIGEKCFLTLNACYNHISNGGIKQPNKGMNFPTIAIGFEYFKNPVPVLEKDLMEGKETHKPRPYFLIQALASIKVLGGLNGEPEKSAFIYGFHARFAKPLTRIYALNAGGEIIVDGYIKESLKRENSDIDHKRIALTAGQDFMLEKVLFTQYLGFYLYSPNKAPNSVYQKYELAYRVNEKVNIGVYLKAHLQVAELMGVSVNFLLPAVRMQGKESYK
jgi:hypothetical protein